MAGTGGRQWQAVGVLGAVLALGVGVAVLAPSGDDAGSPPTTSPASPTTVDATAAQDTGGTTGSADSVDTDGGRPGREPVGDVLDPDAAAAAGRVAGGGLSPSAPRAAPSGRLRLWATQDASRNGGTWLAVQRSDEPPAAALQDAAAVTVDGVAEPALVLVEPDGVVSLVIPAADGSTLRLTAYGIAPDDLAELAGALSTSTPAGEGTILSAQPYGNFGPMRLLMDRPSTGQGLTQDYLTEGIAATAFYRDAAGRIVSVTTSPRDGELEGILAPFALRDVSGNGASGRLVTTGDVGLGDHPTLGAQHVATFWQDGWTVRLASSRDDVDLIGLARATVVGDDEMWQAVQARGRGFVDGRGIRYTTAGSGTFADGAAWTLSLAAGPPWASFFVAEGDGTGTFAELYLDRAPCAAITTREATTVACVRPTADVAVSLEIGQAVLAPFEPTDAGWSIAVARTDQLGPLPILEIAEGREPVTLGRTGGDPAGWDQWAAIDPSWPGAPRDATAGSWLVDGGVPGLTAVGTSSGQRAEPIGTLVLLGTPGASRTSGTWVAIATAVDTGEVPIGEDAIRVLIDLGDDTSVAGMLQTSPDGVSTLQWTMVDGRAAVMVARGLTQQRLLALAASVRNDGRPGSGTPSPLLELAPTADDGTPLAELARVPVVGTSLADLALGELWDPTTYVDVDGRVAFVVGASRASLAADVVAGFLLAPLGADDAAIDMAPVAAQASTRPLVGAAPGWEGVPVVRWRVGDDVVTVVALAPLDSVIPALGASVRAATEDERVALLTAAGDVPLLPSDTTVLGRGVTDGGSDWTVQLMDTTGLVGIARTDAAAWRTLEPSAERPIRVLRTLTETIVVALLPEAGDATALEVTIEGQGPKLLPLVPSASGLTTWVGAAYVVDAADEATLHVTLV